MITLDVQHCGTSVLVSVSGQLDGASGTVLQRTLDHVAAGERILMVDVHAVSTMDPDGVLHVLDLHRRAECLGLRVLIVGWQAQPRQLMADMARIPGPAARADERYALAGFRRLITERARRAQGLSALATAGGRTPSGAAEVSGF
ncbi:STAS domain-containing protein [Streptomyces sp. NPDC051109]|uniref:STAS domain-containing protein n=1 Tax=Streptomyces sp. NPDC051109 TaxID=3365642 RepID=UPI0010668627